MNLGYSEEYLFNFCVNVFNFCVNPRHPVPDVKVLIGRSCVSQVRKQSLRESFLSAQE